MQAEIQRLREVSRLCLAGEPLDSDLAGWLGRALDAFLARQCGSVEEAFGLRFPPGGIPWWREEANRKRDAALRELAGRHFERLSPCAQAQRIAQASRRYAATAWLIDRDRREMPEAYRGTMREFLYAAFASGATMPLGERQLRNILAR